MVSRWELAAEAIVVKIRWFGLLFGYLLVNLDEAADAHRGVLNAILMVGVLFSLVDTAYSLQGKIFLRHGPLLVSGMEALFIGLLCYFHTGLDSPFRYYYLLSLICCAIRYTSAVTYATWALHALSFLTLYFALPPELRRGQVLVLTLVILSWATWASSALASLLKRIGDNLGRLNAELEQNRAHLEARIAERSRDLQEAQAHLLHQEKMAAFGLLAAGIAHEVGNPLTSISSVVQILKRRDLDEYQREKLDLVSGQLERIQSTLRELVNFSRPASTLRTRVSVAEALTEALNIAKYYKRTRSQPISVELPPDLPAVLGVRDQLVQVFLNLILNAIDATATKGTIHVRAESKPSGLAVHIHDTGTGIAPEHAARLFQPYVTTKRHGTGLGLFVTRTLVQQHGGTVTFSSTFGEGATFTVQLPAEPVRPEHRAPPSP